jgi:signal transduction histidine kinase
MSNEAAKTMSLVTYRRVMRFFAAVKKLPKLQLLHDPRAVLKIVLGGTFFVVVVMLALLGISFFALGNFYVGDRFLLFVGVIAYLITAAFQLKKGRLGVASWMVIAFYAVLACIILAWWSINAPFGILMLSFVIVLAGALLGARYIMPVTAAAIFLLLSLQILTSFGVLQSDTSALANPSNFGDVASYSIIFIIFAIISWLSGRQKEQSLRQALTAEAALEQEKSLLSVRLEDQTRNLREVQHEEMQQLYRFAELGQLSAVVLHELANHLTVLTLDIDDIQQRHHRSEAIARVKESIRYLDTMVDQARHQLQENDKPQLFNTLTVLDETILSLTPKAAKLGVSIIPRKPTGSKSFQIIGDPLRLAQILTIIVTNAIEAFEHVNTHATHQKITITTQFHHSMVRIGVTDTGIGIPKNERRLLFEPFQSTKKRGMGIGLFIAKKMIETHFKGNISLDPRTDKTTFVIDLPKYKQ